MANWKATVHLGDFWRDDTKDWADKRDLTVARIKESGWREITPYPDFFDQLVEELAETLNIPEFDYALGELYDLAANDAVWLETRLNRGKL